MINWNNLSPSQCVLKALPNPIGQGRTLVESISGRRRRRHRRPRRRPRRHRRRCRRRRGKNRKFPNSQIQKMMAMTRALAGPSPPGAY